MEEHLKSASPPPSNGVNNSNLNTNDFLLTTQENTNQLNNITNNDIVLQDSNEPSNDERKQRLEEEKKIFQEESLKWENRISADVWDTEAWTSLVLEAQTKDIEIAREIYERFLKQFPTVGKFWKYYVEHEINSQNYKRAGEIFNRCLLTCLNVDLWKTYLQYIKIVQANQPNGKSEIIQAFELALQHVGTDISSTFIWMDYISFLKEQPTSSQYEEGQKITALRKLYHRAIETPLHNLESIWKDYDTFENELNKTLAKALIAEHAAKYMQARTIYREKKRYQEGIIKNMLPKPLKNQLSEKEESQLFLWKKLISYEKSNPQRLEPNILYQRVLFTYNQALLCLYYYPDIWHELAWYEIEFGHVNEAFQTYEKAIKVVSDCLLLYFAYADLLEEQKRINDAKNVYEKLLQTKSDTLIYIQYLKFSRRNEGLVKAREIFKRGRQSPSCTWHLYVADAYLEWRINKDTNVAINIFNLGMKKYEHEPAFLMEYIKFLSHFNEENNLRVLFERIVSQQQIPKEKLKEFWEMYLEFERTYGDLTTISNVEKRKLALYPEHHPHSFLSMVHKYKYLNLWPCSATQLEFCGKEVSAIKKEESHDTQDQDDHNAHHGHSTDPFKNNPKSNRFPKPDISQLVPYTPERSQTTNSANISLSDALSKFILLLPPPTNYIGPIPDTDELIKLIEEVPLPVENAPIQSKEDQSTTTVPPPTKKRKIDPNSKSTDTQEEEEEEIPNTTSTVNAPPNDLFRRRQAAKLKQKI